MSRSVERGPHSHDCSVVTSAVAVLRGGDKILGPRVCERVLEIELVYISFVNLLLCFFVSHYRRKCNKINMLGKREFSPESKVVIA